MEWMTTIAPAWLCNVKWLAGLTVGFGVLAWLMPCNPGMFWWKDLRGTCTNFIYLFIVPLFLRVCRTLMLVAGLALLFGTRPAGFTAVREYTRAPTDRSGARLEPWDVSDGQLWRYIAAADKLCQQRYDARAAHLLARHLLRRERLYAHTLEVGDFKTALAILKDEAELEGHYKRGDGSGALEALLNALPPELARATRAALGAALAGAGEEGGGTPHAAPPAEGSVLDPEPERQEARLVAGEFTALDLETDAPALFPPIGEEPDGGGAGAADGPAGGARAGPHPLTRPEAGRGVAP